MKWSPYRVDQLADVYGGGTPSRTESAYWNGDIPWITPTDLPMPGKGIADIQTASEHISSAGLDSSAATLLPAGSVLYSSRATIGKIGINRVPVTTNQGFVNLVPKPGVQVKYLAYCLLHFTRDIAQLAGSTTFKEVTRGNFRAFRLPLPAPREQNRIVELLEQADALRQKRAAADTLADRILPALFHKLFGDPATNPKNWPTDRLGNVAQLEWGNTSITKASYTQSGFPAYSASGQDGFVANFEHEGDGIVVSAIGARCGKCFFASDKWTAIKNTLTITSPDQSKLDLKYLFAIVNDESFWLKRGGGQPFIALGAARDQRVPLPPLALQQSFACKADLQSFVLNRQTQSQGKTEALFATMLHRAFTGELTAQWREAHLKELLAEMEQQAKALNLPANGKN